jgi:NADH dehydrogenase
VRYKNNDYSTPTCYGDQEVPFRYRHAGNLATVGRTAAVADFGFVRLTGRLAWLVWGLVHIYFLIGFRNRIALALDWLWAYVTFQRGARLITDGDLRNCPIKPET